MALDRGGELTTSLSSEMLLPRDASLIMLGSLEQRCRFIELFE